MRPAVFIAPSLAALLAAPASSQEDRIQFAVSVETVTLDVVVVDERGRFVPGLSAENFEILEDGAPQELSFFTAQFTPVTTLLLLDTSSSIRASPLEQGRPSLPAIQTAAYLFVQNLSAGDRARIGLFNQEVRFGPSYTDSLSEHLGILRSMRPAGQTALYDSILAALSELQPVEGRKSLLLFTDGGDTGPERGGSRASMEEAIQGARGSQATIYTVGFTGWGDQGSESVNREFLTTLAESTGGRAFFPEDVEEVKKAFAEVQEDLHRHYRMAYVPSRAPVSGSELGTWRHIEVKIRGKEKQELFVRTREGYYPRSGPSE